MAHHKRIPKSFCTTREAAELLGVSLRTAQLWTESGLLEAWKTDGGHRRISRPSIERLLAHPAVRRMAAGSPTPPKADEAPRAKRSVPFNILVVEDDPVLRRLYEIKLRAWPMQPNIVTAGEGFEALIKLGSTRPDMMITDLMMPGMDGFQMLKSVCAAPELARTKIVVVSGLDQEEIAHRGKLPESILVLPKPVPFDQLRAIAEGMAAAPGSVSRMASP